MSCNECQLTISVSVQRLVLGLEASTRYNHRSMDQKNKVHAIMQLRVAMQYNLFQQKVPVYGVHTL